MLNLKDQVRRFMVRSARDVAAQALPNWAQIAASLAQNFYDVFIACPEAEQRALLEGVRGVSAGEWASIRQQVAGELGERYAEALDQAREAMVGVHGERRGGELGESLRAGLNQSMRLGQRQINRHRPIGAGVARSLIFGGGQVDPPPRSSWPHVPGFELTGWLGEGAQAKVFVAKREEAGELGAPVALKVGPLTDRRRFEREVELMRRARSPYLLSAISHGVIEGFVPLFWIEMPLMGGQSLADVGAVSLEEGVNLCLGVIQGLIALHEQGVAHRDLKPSNVLLTTLGEVKLADFGLSKKMEDAGASITATGTVVGSPAYMSPEAINGERVGRGADVWALGVLLCEILAGHLPFPGSVAGQVWAAILRDPPQLEGVPDWLRSGIEKCLSKDVTQRPKEASELGPLLEAPMRAYVEQQARARAEEATRMQRREVLTGQLRSESALREGVIDELERVISSLSHREVAAQLSELAARYEQRLEAAQQAQREVVEELRRLSGEVEASSRHEVRALFKPVLRDLPRCSERLRPLSRSFGVC